MPKGHAWISGESIIKGWESWQPLLQLVCRRTLLPAGKACGFSISETGGDSECKPGVHGRMSSFLQPIRVRARPSVRRRSCTRGGASRTTTWQATSSRTHTNSTSSRSPDSHILACPAFQTTSRQLRLPPLPHLQSARQVGPRCPDTSSA